MGSGIIKFETTFGPVTTLIGAVLEHRYSETINLSTSYS